MTLTIKESSPLDNITKPGATAGNSGSNSDPTTRSNPVCLEVAVTIRSLPGEKGEASPGSASPTREETRTVIVFDNGAVLRLAGNFPPGQAVILSNPQGRDVVCRVVSARNLPTVKGYIEVEFLEPIVDFWGIHKSAGQPNVVNAPAAVETQPPVVARPQMVPSEPAPIAPPAPARAVSPTQETLRPTGNAPSVEDVARVVRMSPPPIARGKASESNSATHVPWNAGESTHDAMDAARSYSQSSSTSPSSDLTSLSAATREVMPVPGGKHFTSNDVLGKFSGSNTDSASSSTEPRGKTPLIIAGAAVFLIGLGSGLFFMHHGNAATPSAVPVAAVSQPIAPVPAVPSSVPAPAMINQPALEQAPTTAPVLSPVSASPKESVAAPAPSAPQTTRRQANNTEPILSEHMEAKQPDRPVQRPQMAHDLKMNAPTIESRGGRLVDGSVPEVDVVTTTSAVNGTPGGGLMPAISHADNPPAPPGAFGAATSSGKTANEPKLISSTRPAYPPLAKQASVEGDVLIAAEIDATGKVVAAKATAGPMFLRQAAVDAVREWKYIPAVVNGRPASSQITVKIQFRLK